MKSLPFLPFNGIEAHLNKAGNGTLIVTVLDSIIVIDVTGK